jgi:hypothetical protein
MANSWEIKADGSWIFHGGDDGDSRLRDPEKNALPNVRLWNAITRQFEYRVMYKVYCRSCGADGGLACREATYVIYLCDDCYKDNQDPNFVPMPPDEEIRWRNGITEEQQSAVILAPDGKVIA